MRNGFTSKARERIVTLSTIAMILAAPGAAFGQCDQTVFKRKLAYGGPFAFAIDESSGRAVATFYDFIVDPYPSHALVFQRDGDSWQPDGLINAGERILSFGASVAMHGDRVIIGADRTIEANFGAAYVFRNRNGHWVREAEFHDDCEDCNFGASVALSDRFAIVGSDEFFGSTKVYERVGETWSLHTVFPQPSLPLLEGERLVLYARDLTYGGIRSYRLIDDLWEVEDEVAGTLSKRFGPVALSGDWLVAAGAECATGPDSGRVFLFKWDGAMWVETQQICGLAEEHFFETKSALDGDTLLIMSRLDSDEGGVIRRYQPGADDVWVEISTRLGINGYRGLALSGHTAIAGDDRGRAVIFRVDDECP